MWIYILVLPLQVGFLDAWADFRLDPLNQVFVADAYNPQHWSPLCATTFTAQLGSNICKRLYSGGVRDVKRVKLGWSAAANVHCGLKGCVSYIVRRCAEGIALECSRTSDLDCGWGEISIDRKCVSVNENAVAGFDAAVAHCLRKGLSLFVANNAQLMQKVATELKAVKSNFDWITFGYRTADTWLWPDGSQIPMDIQWTRNRNCLKVGGYGWRAADCEERLIPLCQSGLECISAKREYFGRRNITEKGLECISWNRARVRFSSKRISYGKWLHNYCRNPDGVKERPWCFVTPLTFQYCSIADCPNQSYQNAARGCGADEVRCGDSEECVAKELLCDYKQDCPNGADELNCVDWTKSFVHSGSFALLGLSNDEVRTNVPHARVCAKRCLESPLSQCVSFSYSGVTATCAFASALRSHAIRADSQFEFYKRPSLSELYEVQDVDGVIQVKKGNQWARVCSTAEDEAVVCRDIRVRKSVNGTAKPSMLAWSLSCLYTLDCILPDIASCLHALSCPRSAPGGNFACEGPQLRVTDFDIDRGGLLEAKCGDSWLAVCADSVGTASMDTICTLLKTVYTTSTEAANSSGRAAPADQRTWSLTCRNGTCDVAVADECFGGGLRLRCPILYERNSCGKMSVDINARDPLKQRFARVVGGFETLPGAFPWTVAIKLRQSTLYHCGGSILTSRMILTAAHCFDEESRLSEYEVVVGEWDSSRYETNEQWMNISRIFRYPLYKDLFADDIAVAELHAEIEYSRHALPICLPPGNFDYGIGTKCVVSGWGSIGEDYPDRLQAATLPILPRDHCSNSSLLYKSLSPTAFCAGYLDGSVDSCQGDSGGPFACKIDGLYHICGVVSWGDGCAEKGRPGIYTMVTPYLQWLTAVANITVPP